VITTHPPHDDLQVTLPTWIVLLLRQRAKDRKQSVSAVLETILLDHIMLDEVGTMARRSPAFARSFTEWFSFVTRKTRARSTRNVSS
jgi:hypothetical protein